MASSIVAVGGGATSVKRLASMEVVKESVSGVLDTVHGVVQGVGAFVVGLLSSWMFILGVLFAIFIFASLQHEGAELMTAYARVYNSEVSAAVRSSFLVSMQYSARFLQPVLFLWNSWWYVVKLFRTNVLLPMLMESKELTAGLAGSVGMLARSVSISGVSYVARLNSADCSIDRLMNSAQVANGTMPCFIPGRRALDIITPMGDVRMVVMYSLLLLKETCKVLSAPFDLMAYPFLDLNFAKGLHNIVNALLYWFVSMPLMTVKRCSAASTAVPVGENGDLVAPYPEGHWMRFVMCTPDATPGFNYMIAGVRRWGQLVDNWSNAVWMILLGALGLDVPTCAPIPLTMRATTENTLFGGNETRIVGLTKGVYAITDGASVQYTFFLGQVTNVFSAYAWQQPITLSHGIAAVMYDVGDDSIDANSGQQTMSMMGCRCIDILDPLGYEFDDGRSTRMEIQCNILRYDPGSVGADAEVHDVASPHFVPIAFSVPDAALYMRCATTKITVDSARFPLWRLGEYEEAGKGRNYDDQMDSEYTGADGVDAPDEMDAVVWVMPACDADELAPACQAAMSSAGCMPYCLAARKRGSRNDGLTLYSASDWVNKVQLVDHNCASDVLASTSADLVGFKADGLTPAYTEYNGVAYSNLEVENGQYIFSKSWNPQTQECSYDPTATSRVSRGLIVTQGADLERFKAILLPGQPFVVAGETALTIVVTPDTPSGYSIRVQRLYGQQGTGFVSLVTVNSELPANAPCNTLDTCTSSDPADKNNGIATIPYSVFSDPALHNPAVMTKWGVVYAANPSYEMFSQFFRWCKDQSTSLEAMLLSSHGPIRLWRVDAFAYDDPEGLRASRTGAVSAIPDGFMGKTGGEFCGRIFNVRVSSMEYLNDQNIAVQVLRASVSTFDPIRKEFDTGILNSGAHNSLVSYRTYFLNPETMRLRWDSMWEEDDAASELGQGLLCPSQRRLPDFGSMFAEIISAGFYVGRTLFEVLLTGPAVFTPGAFTKIRNMNVPINYGHSFILNQGIGWINFDQFFHAVRRAHQHFFNAFTKIGALFDDAPYVNQFMNGFALYNQDYTPLVTRNMRNYLGAASRAGESVDSKITGLMSSVAGKNPVVFTGLAASTGMVNMAHYTARMLKTLFLSMLIPAIDAVASGEGGERVVHGLWQVVYDSQENYKTLILAAELRSCVGLQLMLGYTNPLARLASAVCESGVMFKLGTIETAMAFFVDLPMLGCLCTDSQQDNYQAWAIEHCYTAAPTHFKGAVLSLIQGSNSLESLCLSSSLRVQSRIRDAMNPFLAASYRASATLADTVDYLRFVWDADAGSCRDYAGDAAVTAILPDPIEFWRVCAWTNSCKAKCSSSISTFEASKLANGQMPRDVRLATAQTTVQSSFFSDMDILASRSLAPFDILEMSEMRDCFHTCGFRNALRKDRCVAILGIEYGGIGSMTPTIVVAEYCVPDRLDASVWMARKWSIANSHQWVSSMLQIRLLHQGGEHCASFSGAFCSVAVLRPNSVSLYREDGHEYVLEKYNPETAAGTRLTDINRIATLGNDVLLIYGIGFSDGPSSPKITRSLCVDTRLVTRSDGTKNAWTNFAVYSCNQNVIDTVLLDIPICVFDMVGECSSVLLIPTREEIPAMRCNFETGGLMKGQLVERGRCVQFTLTKGAIHSAGLYDSISQPLMGVFTTTTQQARSAVVLATSISAIALQSQYAFEEYNIFVGNHPKRKTNWLAVMRLDTRIKSISYHGSVAVNVDVTVKHGCRVDDCTGCKTRTIQTLCYSAQQCTIAKCIGTTVNLNKPLCSVGKLLGDSFEHLLLQWRSGWNLMSIMLIQSIAVASTGKTSTDDSVTGSDELMASVICLQKDTVFDVAGAITSFLNANINMVDDIVVSSGNVGALFNPPKIVDVEQFVSSEYREAQRTMVLAAVTRFLGNIGLGIVYPLIVARKMMICQANDIISIFDIGGMELTITSPAYEDAYSGAAGKCMTDFEAGNVDSADSSGVNAVLDGIVAWLGTIPFANYKHVLDAMISYVMGLIRGVQDMVQVSDVKHCKLRDPGVVDQGRCACGDDPVEIPRWRRAADGSQYENTLEQHSFWCSGFLRMETPFGTPLYVFNPYTYAELVEAAVHTDAFLTCIATKPQGSCIQLQPEPPELLQQQGAQLLAVITRCNANYQAMQWDAGATQLYRDPELLPPYLKHMKDVIRVAHDTAMASTEESLTACMRNALADAISNDGCLSMYLAHPSRGQRREDFFVYESIDTSISVQTQKIAACIVFSGPSKVANVGTEASESFRQCTDPSAISSNTGKPCKLRSYVWSSTSRNAVPVANMHSVMLNDLVETRYNANTSYVSISKDVLDAVEKAAVSFHPEDLKVGLFTAEGDWLHQAFDCVLMGPYGRADLSLRDVEGVLPALEYFRDTDGGATREFELPCTGDNLKGDIEPPFTCGSDVRRSIIKSFVRGGGGNMDDSTNAQIVDGINTQVLQLFADARRVFRFYSNFACRCSLDDPRKHHSDCCLNGIVSSDGTESVQTRLSKMSGAEKRATLTKLVPSHIRDFHFTTIDNSDVSSGLVDLVFEYLETDIWTNVSKLTSFDVDHSKYILSAQQRDLAGREGLYQTVEPLTSYDSTDAFDQITTMSAFEVCMGAVSQVMFTLPVGDYVTGAPTTLAAMDAWDPTQTLPQGHFTALEVWVRSLVADAEILSPLFWSHRLKHVASDSLVCAALFDETSDLGPAVWSDATAESDGFAALAASVHPGPSRGIYESWVDDVRLAPPEGVRETDAIFRETNRSMWALGEVTRSCFCGWDSTQDIAGRVWCMIPSSICTRPRDWSETIARICEVQYGMYWNHWQNSEDSRIVGSYMQSLIQEFDRLDCPWNMVDSASWGLLDEETFETHWLLDNPDHDVMHVSSKTLLYEGRGGVRYMNAVDVLKRGRDSPLMLFNPLEVASTVAQHHCEAHVKARNGNRTTERSENGTASPTENRTTVPGTSYADHFRDVLFPAVQGVPENRGTAFCLRYVVEFATLIAMQKVLSVDTLEIVEQLDIVEEWNRKCHTQTKLLGFCALRNVFSAHRIKTSSKPPTVSGVDDEPAGGVPTSGVVQNHPACIGITFTGTIGVQDSFVVVGASCVVVYHSASEEPPRVLILDPCRTIHECHGNSSTPFPISAADFIADQSNDPSAVLDPSSFISTHSMTLSLKWSAPDDPHWEPIQQARNNYAEEYEGDRYASASVGLDIEKLWQQYVIPDQSTSPGTTRPTGAAWHSATGPRSEEIHASCGGVSDWWPDTWEHPVGFHVTTPCASDTAEYRTFSNQFEYDAADHTMHYKHSALRDEHLMMNNAGASGMCRLNTFAQTLREQNNIRVCTRMVDGVAVDYAVPLRFDPEGPSWTDEMCSTSPLDVPWKPSSDAHARTRSSGLLVSWPDSADGIWPPNTPSESVMVGLGLRNDSTADSWTSDEGECGMPPLYTCNPADPEQSCQRHVLGLPSDVTMECMNFVCMVIYTAATASTGAWATDANYVQCTDHTHCAPDPQTHPGDEQTLLCSGEGRCVLPIVEIDNMFDGGDVDISWNAPACDATSMDRVDMYGKSPWGRITGLFEAHGLCSYRNWYEYGRVYGDQCTDDKRSTEDIDNSLCTLGENVHWTDTTRHENDVGLSIFESNHVLFQETHDCDRDFHHYENHVMCRPKTSTLPDNQFATLYNNDGISISPARYSALYRTYYIDPDTDSQEHRVKIAHMEYMSNLETGFLGSGDSFNDLDLLPCVSIPQCSIPDYRIQGHTIAERMVYRDSIQVAYRVSDAVQCGAFGMISIPTLSGDPQCTVDYSVASLAYLAVHDNADLMLYCKFNTGYGSAWFTEFTRVVDSPYHGDDTGRRTVRNLLSELLNKAFKTDFGSLVEYEQRMKCGRYIDFSLRNSKQSVRHPYSIEEVDADGQTIVLYGDSTINHFTTYSMAEVAPMWWIKCHLLSGLAVSDTESVQCPAWSRSLQNARYDPAAYQHDAEPSITVKEWLQQSARSFRDLEVLKQEAIGRVRTNGYAALNATRIMLAGGPTKYLTPTCSVARQFKQCDGDENYQKMIFMTYSTGQSAFMADYVKQHGADGCCSSIDECVASTGSGTPFASTNDVTIDEIVKNWIFSSQGYGTLVQKFPDKDLLSAMILQWGDSEIELFSQPWLKTGKRGVEVDVGASLARVVQSSFNGISDDTCAIWTLRSENFNDATSDCIYSKQFQENDPIALSEPIGQASTDVAKVILYHGTSVFASANTQESIDVCVQYTSSGVVSGASRNYAQHLQQRCFIGDENPPTGGQTDDFVCDTDDALIGCEGRGAVVQNPKPHRVCYETGNECFNRANSLEFVESLAYHWKQAYLPPGVRLVTYGYADDNTRIIGRNPRYLSGREKLFWNNTFFDSNDVKNRVDDLRQTTPHHVFARPEASSTEEFTYPKTSRRLLQDSEGSFTFIPDNPSSSYPDWMDEHKCGAGWVRKNDADKMGYSWTESNGADCVRCLDGHYERYSAWQFDGYTPPWYVRYSIYGQIVEKGKTLENGCHPCPDAYPVTSRDLLSCEVQPSYAGQEVDVPVEETTCLFDNPQWPPLVVWHEEAGRGARGDQCEYCETNACNYYRSLSSYKGGRSYPPWYNCGNDPNEPTLAAPEKNLFPSASILDHISDIMQGRGLSRSAATSYFVKHYPEYEALYLDYDGGPIHYGHHTNAGSSSQSATVAMPLLYSSFSLELMPGFTCGDNGCSGISKRVANGYYYCSDCTRMAHNREYCRGTHDCRVHGISEVSNGFFEPYCEPWQKIRISELLLKIVKGAASVFDTAELMVHLTMAQYRKDFIGTEALGTEAFHMRSLASTLMQEETIALTHPESWTFPVYSPERALDWEARTGKQTIDSNGDEYLDIKACLDLNLESAQVSYKQCNRDQQLVALRNRANTAYNTTGPIVLPQGFSVALPVSASHILSSSGGVLLSWAQTERAAREKHFEFLMDFDKHCENTTIWDAVCRIRPADGSIELFNPWTGGGFSATEGCDISPGDGRNGGADIIDSTCLNSIECPLQDRTDNFYRNQAPTCHEQNGAWAPTRIVSPWTRSNVCFLKPTIKNGICTHMQGVLGGGSGTSATGIAHANLYTYAPLPATDATTVGGIFVPPYRDIFRSLQFTASDVGIDKSFLYVNPFDIGGHQMHFTVSRDGVLRLYDLVLSGGNGPDGAIASARKAEARRFKNDRTGRVSIDGAAMQAWMTWDVELEHLRAMQQEPEIPKNTPLHWGCPLKQRLYLSGQAGKHFRPSLPNQRRAGNMFGHHNPASIKYSNTVQEPDMGAAFVNAKSLQTSNGFCFCESLEDCQQPVSSEETCGFLQTAGALGISGSNKWHTSKVSKGQSTAVCTEQLDWPYTGGILRDGSYIGGAATPSEPRESTCNLLDRIHDFEYMYKKSTVSTESVSRNTVAPGGDCYTSTARIASDTNATSSRGRYVWRPAERRSCARKSCAAPPTFTAGPQHTKIPAETSFGVLYRESAERAIAGNLRERLRLSMCPAALTYNDHTCEALDHVLNVSSWVPQTFWHSFLEDVESLFNTNYSSTNHTNTTHHSNTNHTNTTHHSNTSHTNTAVPTSARQLLTEASQKFELTVPVDEVVMWQRPWVFCVQNDPVCSMECDNDNMQCRTVCEESKNRTCTGHIDRGTWLDPIQRGTSCKASLLAAQQEEGFEGIKPINVCDMGSSMNELCVAIHTARNRIFNANCRASGICHEERFFYVPGIYSAANQEFVKSTVETFYLAENNKSCPSFTSASDTLRDSNIELVDECASTQLQIVYQILHSLRVIVDLLMRIAYFGFMVFLNFLRFVFMGTIGADEEATEEPHAWGQVLKYWALLWRECGKMWTAIGDMVFQFMMDSGWGQALKSLLDWICAAIQMLYDEIWIKYICPHLLLPFGEALRDFGLFGAYPFKSIGQGMIGAYNQNCRENHKVCGDISELRDDDEPEGLPVPTRCWSTYSTFLGDPASLSCSAADTCMASDISQLFGEKESFQSVAGIGPCDRCEQPDSDSFARYGCDIITKTCKCGVQSLTRSTCITNDECNFHGTSCDIIDNFFERDSFGSISCNECATEKICLVSPGDSGGYCACSTREVAYSTCADTAVGFPVSAPAFSMCMVALGVAARMELSQSSLYRIEGSKLATSRCDMLDASQRYCISVEMGPGFAPNYVVGLDNLFSRRLLQVADTNSSEASFFRFVIPPEVYDIALHADWHSVQSSVCRHVPRLLLEHQPVRVGIPPHPPVSLADGELLRACVRWRAIGIEILHISNISDTIPETFLISSDDFASVILKHPDRIYALMKRPWVWVRAILHTSYMAPVRLVLRDIHRYFVHASIEAFASTNMLATVMAAESVVVGNNTNVTTNRTDDLFMEFSRGMSIQMANTVWKYVFHRRGSDNRPHVKNVKKMGNNHPIDYMARTESDKRSRQRHVAALGHSILHTHHSRTHWVSEKDIEMALVHGYSHPKGRDDSPLQKQEDMSIDSVDTNRHTRSLKNFVDDSFVARMNAVQKYSSDVALGQGTVQILPQPAAEEFIKGAVRWPPTYVYFGGGDTCKLATSVYRSVIEAANLLSLAYDSERIPVRPTVSYNPFKLFIDAWERGNATGVANKKQQIVDGDTPKKTFIETISTSPWYIRGPVQLIVSVTGLTEVPFLGLALELPGVISDMLHCDVEAVMYCTRHKFSVFTAAFIAVIVLGIIGAIFSITGIPVVSTLLSLIGFAALTMFIAFGMSPLCLPIVPSCLFETLVTDLVFWLPERVTIPQSLLKCQHDQTLSPVPANCIVECDKTPFYFEDATANFGWLLCEYSPTNCQRLQTYLRGSDNTFTSIVGVELTSAIQKAIYRSEMVLNSGDANMKDAFAWCNVLSLYKLVPLLVLAFLAVGAIPLILAVILRSIISLIRTALAAYVLSHI